MTTTDIAPTQAKAIRWERDADGIVVLTMDDPGQSANTMNAVYTESMGVVVDRLEAERDSVTGVVLTSAKKTFFAGGDLNDLIAARPEDAAALTEGFRVIKDQLRRLETLGVPVVAALNGAALGGGLEIALACHRRIAADVRGSAIGLPEVTLGLLPGGGGVVRTVRMLGIRRALADVLLEGRRFRPCQALELGLVDEVTDTVEELVPRAKAWIRANPGAAAQPWDADGYRMPGGLPDDPAVAALLPSLPAALRKKLGGAPLPAPRAILAAAVEGARVDVDTALEIETRYLVHLATGQVSKNMIKAFFFDLQHINSGGSRPKGFDRHTIRRVGMIGSGAASTDIARVVAESGIEVVLNDSADAADLDGVDLVVKAASEGRELQREIGIHFPPPVHGTPLAEIVRGAKTPDATLARTIDLVRQIGRIPIVVREGRGFFTSRVLRAFLDEALAAVGEGLAPVTVEQAGAQAGYATPPLRLLDRLTLSRDAHGAHAGTVIDRMLDEFGRRGRPTGAGFHDYDGDGKPVGLWPGLHEAFASGGGEVPLDDIKERMLFAPAIEAVRCLDEGVLASVPEANIGSLYGIGFPYWTGGAVQYVNQYPGGLSAFVARAQALAAGYGPRFAPPASLVERAGRGELLQ